MKHVVRATERELNKIGKLFNPPDFEEYSRYLRSTDDPEQSVDRDTGPDGQNDEPVDDAATRESLTRKLGASPDSGSSRSGGRPSSMTETQTDSGGSSKTADTTASSAGIQTVTETTAPTEWEKRYAEESDDDRRSPENVVVTFFDRILDGDRRKAHKLYHSEGSADRFSDREAAMVREQHRGLSSFDRVHETDRCVVLRFTQRFPERDVPLEYELRTEGGEWRIFAYREVGGGR
jgi:hypothetical protein